MTKHAIITGTSSGLGYVLAEVFLENGFHVLGISRREKISHKNYRHLSLDLSKISALNDIDFQLPNDCEDAVLINNAGQISPVGFIDHVEIDEASAHLSVNVLAVHALMGAFYRQSHHIKKRHIINVSSGAGKYPVKGWSLYCGGKAAVDMFSRVASVEYPDVPVWSVGPGIVDTDMQREIRKSDKDKFPDIQRFIDYYKNGDLFPAEEVARVLYDLYQNPLRVQDSVFSIRDFM
ncbi:MAG: SDR family NAD(P)-dependent oxidoreductase [Cryomorphaceae bacterium]|nr:SDR family NAD(P)-dependent oxidoreductase [Cryomorphaceae bacterium]